MVIAAGVASSMSNDGACTADSSGRSPPPQPCDCQAEDSDEDKQPEKGAHIGEPFDMCPLH
jgi:hypothetical protein